MTGPDPAAERPPFPFSAVVGAEEAKLALLLATVDPALGGVLLRGDKGSAKTTLARGVAVLTGPGTPFVDLPLGATEERVVGSLDLAAALGGDGVRVQEGLLAAAHGGVLYVDEVNLLADHLVDVLLDVAASGLNRIERDGVSHRHPARFVLVGSMNPEEGDLRPQLLDRFGLAVDVRTPPDPARRAEAVRRRLDHDADPVAFGARWAAAEDELRRRLHRCRPAPVTDAALRWASEVCAAAGTEGLRGDLVLARAAAAHAGWQGRREIHPDDVRATAPLVLAHRARRHPLDPPGAPSQLSQLVDDALQRSEGPPPAPPTDRAEGAGQADQDEKGRDPGARARADESAAAEPGRDASRGDGPADEGSSARSDDGSDQGRPEVSTDDGGGNTGERAPGGERRDEAGPTQAVALALQAPRRVQAGASGRRSTVVADRGRTIGSRSADATTTGVAPAATVAAAARRWAADPAAERRVEPTDLRAPVRTARTGNLLVVAVDASGSMGAQARMSAVKGALLGLLVDAYQRRDRVALVTFRGTDAEVALRPTASVEIARSRLEALATGGETPLAAGLDTALDLAVGGATAELQPLLVVVTDGRATAGPDAFAAALRSAAAVARRRVPAVVIDVEPSGPGRLGLAAEVAAAMGARCLTLAELTADRLEATLRLL